MANGWSCWPAGAHRLADGEVVRGNVKNAVMLANGNPSQVITRPSNEEASCRRGPGIVAGSLDGVEGQVGKKTR